MDKRTNTDDQTMDIYILLSALGHYLRSNSSRIAKTLLDFAFIMESLFLAMIGLQRLMQLFQGVNYLDASSILLTVWIFTANVIALLAWFFNGRTQRYVLYLCFALFMTSVMGLGFLGLEEKYVYFLGFYLALYAVIKAIPWLYRRSHHLS